MQLAPIVIFTYNRPSHTRQTIEALLTNPLAKDSSLYIYSDAPKNHEAEEKVSEVRKYIHTITGFKNINILERERNFGLADNIIDGVTTIINQYGKIIVLEDDIVVSPVFLNYMNDALNHYTHEKKVWCISAWNYPIDPDLINEDTFFWRIPHCWGWATWNDRWQYYKRDIQWVDKNFTKKEIGRINLDGAENFWNHFVLNKQGKIKTWAIFWYLIAIKHQALTLMPKISYIRQIGFDENGTHCGQDNPFQSDLLWDQYPTTYPTQIVEKNKNLQLIQDFYNTKKRVDFKKMVNKLIQLIFKRKRF